MMYTDDLSTIRHWEVCIVYWIQHHHLSSFWDSVTVHWCVSSRSASELRLFLKFKEWLCNSVIVQSDKSHNAPVPYPTMHHFRTEMCTFLFWMVHCWIWDRCKIGFLNWSIEPNKATMAIGFIHTPFIPNISQYVYCSFILVTVWHTYHWTDRSH